MDSGKYLWVRAASALPANVPPLKENTVGARSLFTVRLRLEEHRRSPGVRGVPRLDGPDPDLRLESFDGTGAWRIHDGGARMWTRAES